MRTIYRVEDETGAGPYKNGPNPNRSIPNHHFDDDGPLACDTPNRPGPLSDTWDNIEKLKVATVLGQVKFGFADLSQLHMWFDMLAMRCVAEHGRGFGIATYEAPNEDVINGEKQVAFLAGRAKRTNWEPISVGAES